MLSTGDYIRIEYNPFSISGHHYVYAEIISAVCKLEEFRYLIKIRVIKDTSEECKNVGIEFWESNSIKEFVINSADKEIKKMTKNELLLELL